MVSWPRPNPFFAMRLPGPVGETPASIVAEGGVQAAASASQCTIIAGEWAHHVVTVPAGAVTMCLQGNVVLHPFPQANPCCAVAATVTQVHVLAVNRFCGSPPGIVDHSHTD